MSEFDTDTAVTSVGDGTYTATVTDRWNAIADRPNGGHLLAIMLRALGAELPQPDPLVTSAFFLRPARVGPVTVHTSLARAGRRIATGEARLTQDGKDIVRLTASYLDFGQITGRTAMLDQAPDLPAPADCVNPLAKGGVPGVTIADRFEFRYAEVPGWFLGKPGNRGRASSGFALPMGASRTVWLSRPWWTARHRPYSTSACSTRRPSS